MSAIDTIGGGNIEPRGLEEEMRSAYLDYAMSVIVSRAARRARWPEAGPAADYLRDVRRHGPGRERQVQEVCRCRRRGHGQVPPARRLLDSTRPWSGWRRTSRSGPR